MHRFANPARFLRLARWLTPLLLLTGIVLTAGTVAWGLWQVPQDRLMGDTVRILFVHVPSAWLGMGGWTTIAIASLAELVWRHPLAGIAARAAAVPGAVFTAICLVTGSIWARPTWGAWWVWDGRLTSFLVLLFLYLWLYRPGRCCQPRERQFAHPCDLRPGRRDQHPDHQSLGCMVEQPASACQHLDGQVFAGPRLSLAAARRDNRLFAHIRGSYHGSYAHDPGRFSGRSPTAAQG